MNNKKADTHQPIHTLLAERWSPRAFDIEKPVESGKLQALIEAARWAPSCYNDQPWRFIVCNRHTDSAAWENAAHILVDKNQRWARHAPVLILVCADGIFGHNSNQNRWAQYDTGAASMNLCLQAEALGLFTHQMGGFDVDAARNVFGIPATVTPMAVLAVGYQGSIKVLDADFIDAEQAARVRKPAAELVFEGRWR